MEVKEKAERVATITAGHTMSLIINNWFDYGVYVPVIAYFGPIQGGIIMTILSFIVSLTLIYLYDKTGRDWLGFEMIKEQKNHLSKHLNKFLRFMLRKSNIAAFIGLSVYDPFFATIYLREKDNVYNGLSKRDWMIFISSTIISNIGWTTLVFGGVELIKIIYTWFAGL